MEETSREQLYMADEIKQTVTLKGSPKQRSLSGILTLFLTLTVMTLAIGGISFITASKNKYRQLEEKADDFMSSIDELIEVHLWHMDRENIKKIARAYVNNDNQLEYLEVRDKLKIPLFIYSRTRNAPVIRKSGEIFHAGQLVGHIDMAFTTQGVILRNQNILSWGLGLLIVTMVFLTLATGLFFKTVLGNFIQSLNAMSDGHGSGKDIAHEHQIVYREFQPLIDNLGDMRNAFNIQIAEIQNREKKYQTIFEHAVVGIFQSTSEGLVIDANPAMAQMFGYQSPQALIQSISNLGEQLYVFPDRRKEFIRQIKTKKTVTNFHTECRTASGKIVCLSLYARSVWNDNDQLAYIEGVALDISQQKKAEEERKSLEAQLIHSQKLESAGRLAGGVAHDFNNMLSIILGYSDMMLQTVTPKDPNYERLIAISSAANRSADLNGQLLAFASQQTVSPKVLDLNKKVNGMMNMLKRLLREDIDLKFIPGKDIGMVNIDPTQLDQILVNLCMNARDAILVTGEISIATGQVVIDEAARGQHSDAVAGDYVTLSVSDNGCGMESSMLDNIFDPFFTTKEDAMGSGLGLSTIYGIVKQNNGNIHVHSELGNGTVFTVYLPECRDAMLSAVHDIDTTVSFQGDETILLVDDEEALLHLSRETLEQLGYTVLAAGSAVEALRIAAEHPGEIRLLMTDIIMPDMNGLELADKLLREHPGIRCLYVSGYTTDIFSSHGVLEDSVHFLQKPFAKDDLEDMLQKVLS